MCQLPSLGKPVTWKDTGETSLHGPVVLGFLEDVGEVAACGTWNNKSDKTCHRLSAAGGSQPSWKKMPSLMRNHCPAAECTWSHYLTDIGWLIIGPGDDLWKEHVITSTELFDHSQFWIPANISSPFTYNCSSNYHSHEESFSTIPANACTVKINNSHIMVTGGDFGLHTNKSYILNMADFTWTETAEMPVDRAFHGCALTGNGEVLVAGGEDGQGIELLQVQIYNFDNNSWRHEGSLPASIDKYGNYYLTILLWEGENILPYEDQLWIRNATDFTWKLMNATLGEKFYGRDDPVIIVPGDFIQCP